MKRLFSGIGIAGVACALLSGWQAKTPTTILITGDLLGHLEPCGCTFPQTGGLLREATLIRKIRSTSNVIVLASGSMVASPGRQSQIKTETVAAAYHDMGVDVIGLGNEDTRLGFSGILAIQNNAPDALISGSLQQTSALNMPRTKGIGSLLVGSVSSHPEDLARPVQSPSIALGESIKSLKDDAKLNGQVPVLMVDGTVNEAKQIASQNPEIRLIVYRSPNDVPIAPIVVGKTVLVTPGQGGKKIVRLTLDDDQMSGYQVIPLGPEFSDDPTVSKTYQSYLKQIDQLGLIDKLPRSKTSPYAGSAACMSCHQSAYKVWSHSKHAHALQALENVTHAKDPDCVSCHVVGLNSESGFRSRTLTPTLAGVGCESCHGPAKRHTKMPRTAILPKVGSKPCISCHTSEQDPNFNALTFKTKYWPKIKH